MDADFEAHPKTGRLVVTKVLLGAPPDELRIEALRRSLSAEFPGASNWIARARLDELQTALRIVEIPGFREREWPSRVWNAAVHGDSKRGDASRIASILGCRVRDRASTHAVWFYGQGAIRVGHEVVPVDGEAVIPDRLLQGATGLDAEELGVVENRDLASLAPGLVMALDGQCTPSQAAFLARLHKENVKVWAWPDVDGAGVMIARTIRSAHPRSTIVGLQRWPDSWARSLSDEQRLQALDAAGAIDEWSDVLTYILNVGWVEQEKVYAELDIQGDPWGRLLRP